MPQIMPSCKIFHLFRFLAGWIIYPTSTFWSIWEKIILVVTLIVVNWYIAEAAYSSYYNKHAYGNSTFGNVKFIFTYFFEAFFVFDIFVSMKKTNFIHIHEGELLILTYYYYYQCLTKVSLLIRRTYGQLTFGA